MKHETVIGSIDPNAYSKKTIYFWISIATLILAVTIYSQIEKRIDTQRGVEITLDKVKDDEACNVLRVDPIARDTKIEITTTFECTSSGKHEYRGEELPHYFMRTRPYGVRQIAPEDYEKLQKRPW